MNYLSFIMAIVPIIIIGFYFYKKDDKKEPNYMVVKLFLSGFISAILTIIISLVQLFIFPDFTNYENLNLVGIFIYSFIFISLVEELSKWLMIHKLAYNHKEFDQIYDIILYSVFVGLGFALLENFIYVFTNDNSLKIAIFRGFTSIPAHASFQVFMGYFLGQKKLYEKLNPKLAKKYHYLSIIIPVLLHGIYDFLLLANYIPFLLIFFIFIIIMFIFTIKNSNRYSKNNININEHSITPNGDHRKRYCSNCGTSVNGNYCSMCGHRIN